MTLPFGQQTIGEKVYFILFASRQIVCRQNGFGPKDWEPM